MIRYAAIFFSPLLMLVGLLVFFYQRSGFFWLTGTCIALVLITARIVARHNFWRYSILWLNLIMVLVSEMVFLILVTSGSIRTVLSFVICASWGIQWWFLKRYFDNLSHSQSRDYLSYSRFIYYIGLWFMSVSMYSLILIIHIKMYWAALVLLIALVLWTYDLIRSLPYAKLSVAIVSFLTMQIAIVTYLLPISFWVSGSIVAAWYFMTMDKLINQEQSIKNYFLIFTFIISALLITSII